MRRKFTTSRTRVEEWRYYFDAIQSSAFKLSFTVNHAHLVPEGIAGFVEAIDMGRVEEVRLADCFRNGHEVHLKPGAGDIDFADTFQRIEGKGFKGHYTNAFGHARRQRRARATGRPREERLTTVRWFCAH